MEKILVIDDHMGIRLLLSEELMEAGYDVVGSDQTGEIFSLIEGNRPDLVVMEMKPGTAVGPAIIRDIGNRYHGLPVILWTAYPFFNAETQSVKPDYCVTKNSDLSELKSRIRWALDGRSGLGNPAPR